MSCGNEHDGTMERQKGMDEQDEQFKDMQIVKFIKQSDISC